MTGQRSTFTTNGTTVGIQLHAQCTYKREKSKDRDSVKKTGESNSDDSKVGNVQSKQGIATQESLRFRRPLSLTPTDIDRSPSPKLSGARPTPIHRIHGVHTTGKGITAICQAPLVPKFEPTGMPGDGGVTLQCTLIGDSLNDQQRSDDLSNPRSHQATCPKIWDTRKHEPESRRGWGRRHP